MTRARAVGIRNARIPGFVLPPMCGGKAGAVVAVSDTARFAPVERERPGALGYQRNAGLGGRLVLAGC